LKKPDNPKEQNLVKGALRRVFSRSELRKEALQLSRLDGYHNAERPRVTRWSRCPDCGEPTPTYLMEVDHVIPLVGITESLDDLTWDEVVNRLWCDIKNLRAICKLCHRRKSKAENKARRINKSNRSKSEKI
jgi:5-methylcytosine-specific restriction endonuclease McrA